MELDVRKIRVYVHLVKSGKLSIKDVPNDYRKKVNNIILNK